jgi:hypothetical protein
VVKKFHECAFFDTHKIKNNVYTLIPNIILTKNKDRFVSVAIHKIKHMRYIFFDDKVREKVICLVTVRRIAYFC